jgi:multicomponent Na+:H+ antiporter subunit D
MMGEVHPALILITGGVLLSVLPVGPRRVVALLLPVFSFVNLLAIPDSALWEVTWGEYTLTMLRMDRLSLLFGYLFHLAAFIATIYSLHLDDRLQISTGLMYAGSAVGAVFAGDLISLFVFWEMLAVTSAFQIWARRTQRANDSGMRYLMIHISSGLLLLVGSAMHYLKTGSLAFDHIGLESSYAWLILMAFGIKAAFPFLHTWLVDAYPEATPTGTVFLSAFTTKAAIYALARGFAGEEILIVIGGVMTMFPIFFAVIENDLRRVLGYSMINQIGFMVVGIGLGPGMGVNGAVAHAFNDVIFKGLLFMSMGAVLMRTGKINGSELGGLYKSMPYTCLCCMVGASSISAFPLFSGFISKSMVMQAAANGGFVVIWLALLFASAGVFHHAGIKIPFFAFFSHDSGIRCKEAPLNMRIAMTIAAVLCVFIGSYPPFLYSMLPYPVDYAPFTTTHVILQLQVLFFSALAFTVLKLTGIYPPELPSTNLDVDWTYRRLLPLTARAVVRIGGPVKDGFFEGGKALIRGIVSGIREQHDTKGLFGRSWLSQSNVLIVMIFLAIYLIYYY